MSYLNSVTIIGAGGPPTRFFLSARRRTMRRYHFCNSIGEYENGGAPPSGLEGGGFGVGCRRDCIGTSAKGSSIF